MKENEEAQPTGISKSGSLGEIAEYWDTHSLDDHWNQTHEVEFDVRAKKRRRITVDPEVYQQLETQARTRGISPETLANLWIAERLQEKR